MATSPKTSNRRLDTDIVRLVDGKHMVQILDDRNDLCVIFRGPIDTPYEGGTWKVYVHIPENYPFKSPSIGFMNRIFHPNIDEDSGTVCLDVINQAWTPLYGLINIFDAFLPQLLTYPNPQDPLNQPAAALYIEHPEAFKKKVSEHIQKYATEAVLDLKQSATSRKKAFPTTPEVPTSALESESSLSDMSEDESTTDGKNGKKKKKA